MWSLCAHKYPKFRMKQLWWCVTIAEVSIVVQMIFGILSLNRYGIKISDFHIFYAFVMLFSVAILYSYRIQLKHRLFLLYGLGGLFVMGLGIRAMLVIHKT